MTEPTKAASLLPQAREGELLWTPRPEQIAYANLTAFQDWLRREGRFDAHGYTELWRWSTEHIEDFWRAIWDYFHLQSSTPVTRVLGKRTMPGAEWFPGTRLNYAQHILRNEQPGTDVLMHLSESQPLAGMKWEDLAGQARKLAMELRRMGVRPGDRVVAYMPNIPQTVVALLATSAIGAVWASCSPDFGSHGVLDRLQQVRPKVLFCVDGYRYGGKPFDRRQELAKIIARSTASSTSSSCRIWIAHATPAASADARLWSRSCSISRRCRRRYVRVRTGALRSSALDPVLLGNDRTAQADRPGHGGILLEQYKALGFSHGHAPGRAHVLLHHHRLDDVELSRQHRYSGASVPVLYDGNPAYPETDALWSMAQDCGVSFFGASPTTSRSCAKPTSCRGRNSICRTCARSCPRVHRSPPSARHGSTATSSRTCGSRPAAAAPTVCTGLVGSVPTLPVLRRRDPGAVSSASRPKPSMTKAKRSSMRSANW